MDGIAYMIVIHELARVDASHAITVSAHTTLGTSPIVNFGTPEQKERFVPPLASGTVLGGFGLTEPGAGSDAGGTQTTAVKADGGWVLNGSKIFITHAGVGEIFVVTAQTDRSKGTKGITSFIVSKPTTDLEKARELGVGHSDDLPFTKGVRAGKKEDKMGWRASDTRELVLEEAFVPDDHVLGEVGQGFVNFMKTLDSGRIGIAALSLGIAEGAYEQAVKYATERRQFGKAIADFQGIQFMLADMATEIEAAKHLVYHAAWLKEQGRPYTTEASMAKLFASEAAMRDHHQGRAGPRRLRLHQGIPGGAHDARRQDLRDRGGDQRDPATGDRPQPPPRPHPLTAAGRRLHKPPAAQRGST
jgi:alkylation response protein AidB-like acyl-CoA dehydrogenase